jgi:hypothetical protein
VIISPSGVCIDLSIWLKFACTNNQIKYKSLLHWLKYLRDLGARDVDVFGDTNLIVQQIKGDSQCLYGVLNSYRERCLDIIKLFDTFSIKHIPREENNWANQLTQQASGYVVSQRIFWVASISLVEHRYTLRSKGKPLLQDSDRLQDEGKSIPGNMNRLSGKTELESGSIETEPGKTEPSSDKERPVLGNANQLLSNVDWLSGKAAPGIEPGSSKVELGSGFEVGLWEEVKPTLVERFKEESVMKNNEVGKDGSLIEEGKTKPITEGDSVKGSDTIQTDWRFPLLECIKDPGKTMDKKVKWQLLKYTSVDDDLYQRTIDSMLLKCLGEEQAKVPVREVHDGICGAHQSAYKMNWLLRRAGFYWPTMMDDCIKYQKGCEACQRFRNIQLAPAGVMNSIMKSWPFRG